MADKKAKEQKGIPVAVLVVALVVILGGGFFLYLDRASRRPPPPPAPLSAEAKAYVHSLQLLDVDMQKHESYMKQAVVEITGKIGTDGFEVEQHILQLARDGDLGYRKCQFAVSNPKTGCAAGIIPGHDINTETDQFGDVETVANAGDQLLGRRRAFLDI